MRYIACSLVLTAALTAASNVPPPEAAAWWAHVKVMAADNMEGRDTGSAGYARAARYVAGEFGKLGLRPAGEKGYFQAVPMLDVRVNPARSKFELVRNGKAQTLRLNHQIGITARTDLPRSLEAPLVFIGNATTFTNADVKEKLVVQFRPRGAAPARSNRLKAAGAKGVITIDDPQAIEPPRWPIAYARAVSIDTGKQPEPALPNFRLNDALAEELLEGSGHKWTEFLNGPQEGAGIVFPLTPQLRAAITVTEAKIASDNLLGVLPGSDPQLADQYVLVSAHLDGYGFGEAVKGDKLYNGAFDDAACVANLLQLAADLRASGKKLRRSLLFAVYTGEEKGLLGSNYLVGHLTVPKEKITANINLDYIRPMFSLKLLTVLGLDESTLGDDARKAGAELGIKVQPDMEPQRSLFTRSDQYNFIRNGVPGVAFIFGYEPGSKEEQIYRAWYRERYHKPQDDLNQPIDFPAAVKFHRFFSLMTQMVANADAATQWKPGSPWAPKPAPGR